MTPKEAFKVAFLEKCAAAGLDDEQVLLRVRAMTCLLKTAKMEKSAAGVFDFLKSIGGGIGRFATGKALPLALIAPPVAGLAGGYAVSQMRDDTFDKKEARKREEIAEMRRAIGRLQQLRRKQLASAK